MTSPTVDVPAQHSRFAVEGWLLWLQVAMGLSFIAVAPLFPLIIDDYGIDNATTSLLIGVGELVFAIATIPGGVLAARFGWRRATIFGGALMSIMVLAPLAVDPTNVVYRREAGATPPMPPCGRRAL